MKHEVYNLKNYDLHTVETNRFKTISFVAQIRIKNEKIHDKYIPMLWRMLVNTSAKYKTIKEICEASANIYEPNYSIRFIGSGSQDVLVLSGSFINEKYTEKGMNEESIKFLLEFLFNPNIDEGGFDKEIFEIQKNRLVNYYKNIKDYPREYASYRYMANTKYYDYDEYTLEELIEITESLTRKELYEFYKKIIKEGKFDIFICGNFNSLEMKEIVERNVDFKGFKQEKPAHQIIQKTYRKNPKIIIEKTPNAQSFLIMGLKTTDITKYESIYVSLIYAWILGGGFNSLLNQVVREKNSLCYYIYVERNNLISGLRICAGIDGKDYDKVYELIEGELVNMQTGNFSSELFDSVKNIYYNSLENIEDYQNDILNSFISMECIDADDIKTRKEIVQKMTKEDIMNYAKKTHIDVVYLLKGDKNE
ncbi:MAG: insulinase family protein [Bacilli bacterium]|nr:insulinase family protein [Bacilli bacterium]